MVGAAREDWRLYVVLEGHPELAPKYRQAGRGRTPGEVFPALRSDLIFRMPANKAGESGCQVVIPSKRSRKILRNYDRAFCEVGHLFKNAFLHLKR